MSPRPGFVLDVDRSTPPTLFWHGEGYRLERLPTGSRVVYPPEARPALDDPVGAIQEALENPLGDSEPLSALLRSGMRHTIAFDDISLPLPPMRRPDIRQVVVEQVLDAEASACVDDVVLIAALALHRRMTEAELRHALGDRVYDAFAPHDLLRQHDAEDPSELVHLGVTDQDEDVEISKLARSRTSSSTSTSTWWPWTAATSRWPPGWPATAASATTTTPGPCSRAGRSWTSTGPSCTPRTGAWVGSSRRRG